MTGLEGNVSTTFVQHGIRYYNRVRRHSFLRRPAPLAIIQDFYHEA